MRFFVQDFVRQGRGDLNQYRAAHCAESGGKIFLTYSYLYISYPLASRLLSCLCFAGGKEGTCFCFFSFKLHPYDVSIYSPTDTRKMSKKVPCFPRFLEDLGRDVRSTEMSPSVLCLSLRMSLSSSMVPSK